MKKILAVIFFLAYFAEVFCQTNPAPQETAWVDNNGFFLKKQVSVTSEYSGVGFTYTIFYTIPPNVDANTVIIITDVVPSPLKVENPGNADMTISPVDDDILTPTTVTYIVPAANHVQGTYNFQINVHFPSGTTCNGAFVDNYACMRTIPFTGFNVITLADPGLCTEAITVTPVAVNNPFRITKSSTLPYTGSGAGLLYQGVVGVPVEYVLDISKPYPYYYNVIGQQDLSYVTVTDVLPPNANYVQGSFSCISSCLNTAQQASVVASVQQTGNLITFVVPYLNSALNTPYVQCKLTIDYPASNFPAGTTVQNCVSYAATSCNNTVTSNTSCVNVVFGDAAPGGLPEKAVYITNPVPGCTGFYRLSVNNTGNVGLDVCDILDAIPPEVDVTKIVFDTYPYYGTAMPLELWIDGVQESIPATPGRNYTWNNPNLGNHISQVDIRDFGQSNKLPQGKVYSYDIYFTVGAVLPNFAVNNTMTIQYIAPSTLPPSSSTATFTTEDFQPKICAVKSVCNKLQSYVYNDIVRYRFRIQNIGSQDLTGTMITDVLNSNLEYIGNETYYYSTNGNVNCGTSSQIPSGALAWTNVSVNHTAPYLMWNLATITPNCDKLNIWVAYGCNVADVPYYFIEFDVRIKQYALAGSVPNNFTLSGGTLPVPVTSNTEYITVNSVFGAHAEKFISIDKGVSWSKSVTAAPGSVVMYRLKYTNTSNYPVNNITLVDLLPMDVSASFDGMILNRTTSRGSQSDLQYSTVMNTGTLPEIRVNNGPLLPTPAIWVDNTPDVCLPELGYSPTSCNTANWSTSAITGRNVKFDFGPNFNFGSLTDLQPGDELTCDYEVQLPVGTPPDLTACNSFALLSTGYYYIGSTQQIVNPLPTESDVACITSNDTCIIPPDNMVAWWPLDETTGTTARDLMGFNNIGSYVGDPVNVPIGKVAGCLWFTSHDFVNRDYIEVAHETELNFGTGDFSIDAWIQPTDFVNNSVSYKYPIVDKRSADGTHGYSYYWEWNGNGSDQFLVLELADGTPWVYTSTPTTFSIDGSHWYHVAVTVDRNAPDGIKFYVNGAALPGTQDPTNSPGNLDNTDKLYIAYAPDNGPYDFNFFGRIDEIEMFDTALTVTDIAGIYNADAFGKCKAQGSICGFKFNDLNRDGVYNNGEPKLPGWTIQLSGEASSTTQTDSNGNYCFDQLWPGNYLVSEDQKANWTQTLPSPTGMYGIILSQINGLSVTDINFGNYMNDTCHLDSLLINTGIDRSDHDNLLGIGLQDRFWKLVSDPSGAVSSTNAFTLNPITSWDVLPGSRWLGPSPTSNSNANVGDYTYEFVFCLEDTAQVSLNLSLLVDNSAMVYLNGIATANLILMHIGFTGTPATLSNYCDPLFRVGKNVISVVVYNSSGIGLNPTGFTIAGYLISGSHSIGYPGCCCPVADVCQNFDPPDNVIGNWVMWNIDYNSIVTNSTTGLSITSGGFNGTPGLLAEDQSGWTWIYNAVDLKMNLDSLGDCNCISYDVRAINNEFSTPIPACIRIFSGFNPSLPIVYDRNGGGNPTYMAEFCPNTNLLFNTWGHYVAKLNDCISPSPLPDEYNGSWTIISGTNITNDCLDWELLRKSFEGVMFKLDLTSQPSEEYIYDNICIKGCVEPYCDTIRICQGTSDTLKPVIPGGIPPYSFVWSSDPAGFVSNLQNPVVSPLEPTTYTATITDSAGQELSYTVHYINLPCDYGDAPDPSYGYYYNTLFVNNGARHIVDLNVRLGTNIDAEPDGVPGPFADGDDNNAIPDDEDGITQNGGIKLSSLTVGTNLLEVNASVNGSVNGFLNAWVDLDQDRSWGTNEQLWTNLHVTSTSQFLIIPSNTLKGNTFARFRFTRDPMSPAFPAGMEKDGEVEDYMVSISDTISFDTICEGSSDTLKPVIPGGIPPYSYLWSSIPPGFVSDIQNPEVSPLSTTTYSVAITDSAGLGMLSTQVLVVKACDYGDAPDPSYGYYYNTLFTNNGARHVVDLNFKLGSSIYAEVNGIPGLLADGDDNNDATDEEDGITQNHLQLYSLVTGNNSIEVTASDHGHINAWVDLNQDRSWGVNEHIWINKDVFQGNYLPYDLVIPVGTPSGFTYVRFRFTKDTMSPAFPAGLEMTGEVEDYRVFIDSTQKLLDFGDAPQFDNNPPYYPTKINNNGARAMITGSILLGDSIDAEPDGQPEGQALGDDINIPDDEDGVTIIGPPKTSGNWQGAILYRNASSIQLNVKTQNHIGAGMVYLQGWIDFDHNSVWSPAEQILKNYPVPYDGPVSGVSTTALINAAGVPFNAIPGYAYARFRISDMPNIGPENTTSSNTFFGEVEDYMVYIDPLIVDSPHTIFTDIVACPETVVNVETRGFSFNDIGSFDFHIDYDSTMLHYFSFINSSGFPELSVNTSTPGSILVSGYSADSAVTLLDSTVLFTLQFNYLGGATPLNWYDNGSSCEYRDFPDYNILNDSPDSLFYTDGQVHEMQAASMPLFILGSNSLRCQGVGTETYTASASSTTGITYSLDEYSLAAGNSINSGNGILTYTANWIGTTIITASAAGCGGPVTEMHTVTVQPLPVPAITGLSEVCIGSVANYTSEPGMTNYIWSTTSGGTITTGAGTNSIMVIWNAPGMQWVEVNFTDVNGCEANSPTVFVVNVSDTRTLNLTLFLEGLYDGTGMMRQAQNAEGPQFSGSIADHLTIELYNSISPNVLSAGPYAVDIDTEGKASVSIPSALNANYYVVVRHRNSIKTCTGSPVSFSGSVINYDFSTGSGQAYGDNQKLISGKYVLYAGDANQDGMIDNLDRNAICNQASTFGKGYVAEDLNGDGTVDVLDIILLDNNSAMFVSSLLPFGLPTITTTPVQNIAQTTAISGGIVVLEGGSAVTARGIFWGTTSSPTIAGNHTTDGNGTGVFISNLTGLTANTLYYVRSYATNNDGTGYGNEFSFTTLPVSVFICGDSITKNHEIIGGVAPVDKTVTYGTVTNIPGETSKCWITSNLGADQQASAVNDDSEASAGWYWQFNLKQGYKHDGTTRTPATTWINSISESSDWTNANDPCTIELGSGWRIPTNSEWTNVDLVGNWANIAGPPNPIPSHGETLDSGGWNTWDDPWNSELKLHAEGYLQHIGGSLINCGSIGCYWSSTQGSANTSGWGLYFSSGYSNMNVSGKADGYSIRCLKE